jgi:heme/copper-type cytochrome/quinol oxidase subunit 3
LKRKVNRALLLRCMSYLYLWFLASEVALFFSFFWLIFNFMFFYCDFFGFFIPFYMCYVLFDVFVLFFVFFVDFFNIWVCTLFLVSSGMLTIFCVILHFCNNFTHLFFLLCFVCCFGFLFSCMQFYEFNNFIATFSFWPMFSAAFLLDFLHFTHVFLGFCMLYFTFVRFFTSHMVFIYLSLLSICFYWHFVDVVWFFLLRFVYFLFL